MSTNSKPSFSGKMMLAGLAGASAVSVQTISLLWANNALKMQTSQGLNLFRSALNIYKNGGLKSLYKGAISNLMYASFARFGDTATNFLVLNKFKSNSTFNKTPLFLQSSVSWALASLWRVAITPIGMMTNPENLKQISKMDSRYRFSRTFAKQVKPEIMPLYSWFLVQNYLTENLKISKYSQNSLEAFSFYGAIGFMSMISYDLYKKIKHSVWPPKMPSRFWFNRVFFKGLHGVIFCTSSHYIKEKMEE